VTARFGFLAGILVLAWCGVQFKRFVFSLCMTPSCKEFPFPSLQQPDCWCQLLVSVAAPDLCSDFLFPAGAGLPGLGSAAVSLTRSFLRSGF
jgi:hypothetical protein